MNSLLGFQVEACSVRSFVSSESSCSVRSCVSVRSFVQSEALGTSSGELLRIGIRGQDGDAPPLDATEASSIGRIVISAGDRQCEQNNDGARHHHSAANGKSGGASDDDQLGGTKGLRFVIPVAVCSPPRLTPDEKR